MKRLCLTREQLQFVMTGQKTVDVRIDEGWPAKLVAGNMFCFKAGPDQCVVRLANSIPYVTFEEMLNNIPHESCLPGYKSSRAALALFHRDLNTK